MAVRKAVVKRVHEPPCPGDTLDLDGQLLMIRAVVSPLPSVRLSASTTAGASQTRKSSPL
jgi:hypothetical protein